MMTKLEPLHQMLYDAMDARVLTVRVLEPPSLAFPAIVLPSPLRLEDVLEDAKRLGSAVASRYMDPSCVNLHQDELEGEARLALSNVLHKGWLDRAKTRVEFFKILKTAIANRMRSAVQQNRFTQKRTGIKPPPKGERNVYSTERTKPNEISLDDPDAHLQVSEEDQGLHEDDYDTKTLMDDIRRHCDWATLPVFEQMIEPCLAALVLAQLEARRGQTDKHIEIKISHDHILQANQEANSITGELESVITREGWNIAVLRIQRITQKLRAMNPEDLRYEAAFQALCTLFNVQVPACTKPMVVRRLFTIAARDNWQKITPDVEALLSDVGAVGPKFTKDEMNCYGVLYQRGHKICESCGVKIGCAAQAANVGLGDITIHPKLLGAKLRRVPYIVPNPARTEEPVTSSMRDSEILGYLWKNFKKVTHQGELYFQPKDFPDKQKLLFCVGERTIPLRLRFCNPDQELRSRLVYVNKCFYASDATPAELVIEYINEHAKMAYV